MNHILVIDPNGTVVTLYTEKLDLHAFGGPLKIKRASNVEYDHERRGWTVQFKNCTWLCFDVARKDSFFAYGIDMGVPGKIAVFGSRDDALAAEVDYLQARL